LGNIKKIDLRKERKTLDNVGRCGASKPRASHMCGWVLCETTIARTIHAFRTSKHKQRPHEGTLRLVLVPNRLMFGLAYQGKNIVFRCILEYNSLRDFWPLGNNNNNRSIFIMRIFER
jgi:hypothetical protein